MGSVIALFLRDELQLFDGMCVYVLVCACVCVFIDALSWLVCKCMYTPMLRWCFVATWIKQYVSMKIECKY